MPAHDPRTAIEVDPSCLRVLDDFVAGSRDAVAVVYERFFPALLREAEKLIPEHLRARVVGESIVQSVMCSLMEMTDEQRQAWRSRYCIDNWGRLYGLLATIVARKCLNRVRDAHRQKRDASREVAIDASAVLSGGPAPEDEAAFHELLDQMWQRLDRAEQEVLGLWMEGLPAEQIAARLDLTTATVKAVPAKLSRWLQRLINEAAAAR
jgi:DNA-directed RNA polymerase specialized sigma24 family protein